MSLHQGVAFLSPYPRYGEAGAKFREKGNEGPIRAGRLRGHEDRPHRATLPVLLTVDDAADLLRTTIVAAIGPVTADAAKHYGIDTAIVPAEATIAALVEAIVKYFTV